MENNTVCRYAIVCGQLRIAEMIDEQLPYAKGRERHVLNSIMKILIDNADKSGNVLFTLLARAKPGIEKFYSHECHCNYKYNAKVKR